MKQKTFYRILMAALIPMMQSCVSEEEFYDGDEQPSEERTVYIELGQPAKGRSAVSPDENSVNDFNLYVFNRGDLVYSTYETGNSEVSVVLNVNEAYNVYVLANMGRMPVYLSETEILDNHLYRISTIDDLKDSLPLAGSRKGLVVSDEGQRLSVPVARLVSRISLKIDKDALAGLYVNSVRLCQSALSVSPFNSSESSWNLCSSATEVADGDYASEEDIINLNSGEAIFFYALENCQGVLLPDNEDPWLKEPSLLYEKASLCTYIEVCCSFMDGHFYDGDVTYRLYLGQDDCKDFNLIRNSVLDVSLGLTGEGLRKELSWKVSADVSVRDGYADGWISCGNHEENDLYVGEKFKYSLTFADEMLEYVADDVTGCSVSFEPYQSVDGEVIRFTEIELDEEDNYFVDATCILPSEGEICLLGPDGLRLAVLSRNVVVNVPGVMISDRKSSDGSSMVKESSPDLTCEINGSGNVRYLYLVDEQERNLNVSRNCGYDLDVFDFDLAPSVKSAHDVLSNFKVDVQAGRSGSDGPALILNSACENDGRRNNVNLSLLNACRDEDPVQITVAERNFNLEQNLYAGLEYLPIELTLVDNGWAKYGDTQMSMLVENPSNLPVEVDFWQLMTTCKGQSSTVPENVTYLVENVLNVSDLTYVVNSYNESSSPVYGSSCSFVSERNEYGTPADEDESYLIYPLKGISTDDLIAAAMYDGLALEGISHHLNIEFSDGTAVGLLTVNDCLSDGTAIYEAKYSSDLSAGGWNDRGIWVYAEGGLLLAPESFSESYPGLNPDNMRSLLRQDYVVGMMDYDDSYGYMSVTAYELGAEGLVLDSRCSVAADGYVMTYPKGTWGNPVDNYCSAELTRSSNGFSVLYDGVGQSADNGAVGAVFDAIYAHTYFDSWNKIGSANNYMHSAHPVSLRMDMYFKLADENDQGAYLFSPAYPNYLFFNHQQEGVKYTITPEITPHLFNFVNVSRFNL